MDGCGQLLFLDGEKVEQHLPLGMLITGIERSFVQISSKSEGVIQPQRMFLPLVDQNFFLVKPAVSLPDKTLSAKLLTIYPDNERKYGLPGLQSIMLIFDAETGSAQAVMDGNSVTDLRTAAASAVAVKYMSNEDDHVLALIGTGHQAASHVKLLREIRKFKEIRVFSRSKERREKFATDWDLISCESVEEAVRNANIIVTVTSSKTPVLFHQWLQPKALIVAVGAPEPTSRELDDDIMLSSQVITDSLEASQHCGDIILSSASVDGELGDYISGKLKVNWDRMRVFKSNGMAIQDLVAGRIVVDNFMKSKKT